MLTAPFALPAAKAEGETIEHRRYTVRGIVQGVGFRPFVYRLACTHGVNGFIRNDARGVELELEGSADVLDALIRDLVAFSPPLSEITDVVLLDRVRGVPRHGSFQIANSEQGGAREVVVTPDAYVCEDCRRELWNPSDRRHKYPFINCTNCGPRFSIVRDIPYDRALTTMATFAMCSDCQREYDDPQDRRFHAQPNACWKCGPQVRLLGKDGQELFEPDPILACVALMRAGAVVAVKGIGGYHIMCDADNAQAMAAIRERKGRPHKPFALMSESVEIVRRYAYVSDAEAALLESTARPIVLLRRREPAVFAELVAPFSTDYGVMLAYTPLHHLLLRDHFVALVATSANVTNEPIAYQDENVVAQLFGIVDYFLTHNREIHTRVDDSIVRSVEVNGAVSSSVVRRARGFAPKPVTISRDLPCVLAVGGELKNTICVTKGRSLFLSQHVGDLKNLKNYDFFAELCERLPRVLGVRPDVVACDLHPEFMSTQFARSLSGVELVRVQHHHAHLASCMGDHDVDELVLGVTFDGMGYGADGTAWGGEFLLGSYTGFERVGHVRYMGLPGGDKAVHEPFRIACALLADSFGAGAVEDLELPFIRQIDAAQRRVLSKMIERGINTPRTSSVGRLFDGVAALLGVRNIATYEGQAASEIEQLAHGIGDEIAPLSYQIDETPLGLEVDTRPLVRDLVAGFTEQAPRSLLAARFHLTLAHIVCDVSRRVCRASGARTVALSGGVFLNRTLLGSCHRLLSQHNLRVLSHQKVPTNDGGLSFGQALVAAATVSRQSSS